MFQFTHPGGVRLVGVAACAVGAIVSIHAPEMGTTVAEGISRMQCRVSIHAPGRGATALHAQRADGVAVSIHAPGRGATRRT